MPSQHAQVLVPGDAGDLHDVQSLCEQLRDCLVAKTSERRYSMAARRIARVQERFTASVVTPTKMSPCRVRAHLGSEQQHGAQGS